MNMQDKDGNDLRRAAIALAGCYAAMKTPVAGTDGGLSRAAACLGDVFGLEQTSLVSEIRTLLRHDTDIFNGGFDLMELFGIRGDEVRHTQFLSWLLDPGSPHGLGRRFLAELLKCAYPERPIDDLIPEDYGVYPEQSTHYGTPDIEVSAASFLLLIENKLYSAEGMALRADEDHLDIRRDQPQLNRYTHHADEICKNQGIPADRCFLVFLCIDREQARRSSATRFKSVTWATYVKVAAKVLAETPDIASDCIPILRRYFLSIRRLVCPVFRHREIVNSILAGEAGVATMRLSLLRKIKMDAETWTHA